MDFKLQLDRKCRNPLNRTVPSVKSSGLTDVRIHVSCVWSWLSWLWGVRINQEKFYCIQCNNITIEYTYTAKVILNVFIPKMQFACQISLNACYYYISDMSWSIANIKRSIGQCRYHQLTVVECIIMYVIIDACWHAFHPLELSESLTPNMWLMVLEHGREYWSDRHVGRKVVARDTNNEKWFNSQNARF